MQSQKVFTKLICPVLTGSNGAKRRDLLDVFGQIGHKNCEVADLVSSTTKWWFAVLEAEDLGLF